MVNVGGSRTWAQQLVRWHDGLLRLLGFGQGDGDVLDRCGQARRRPIRGGALHDHDQYLGMRARVIGAGQLVNLLLCEAQSVEHHVDMSGSSSTSMRRRSPPRESAVTGVRSSGALAT